MIFGPSDAEFHLELEDTKKCIHQKLPKQRDSNGRSDQTWDRLLFVVETNKGKYRVSIFGSNVESTAVSIQAIQTHVQTIQDCF